MFVKLFLIVSLTFIVFFVGIGALARTFFGMLSGLFQKSDSSPGRRPSSRSRYGEGGKAQAERMLACAFCGVHVPESEGVRAAGKFFCCKAHCK
ncbi:MAG: hypothetical protein LBP99_10260 [Azoarcus sp.]|nr:hypothetical protein [Azoarcus sp.]